MESEGRLRQIKPSFVGLPFGSRAEASLREASFLLLTYPRCGSAQYLSHFRSGQANFPGLDAFRQFQSLLILIPLEG